MRMIDADALIREMHNIILEDGEDRRIFYEVTERQPTIERKKGKWRKMPMACYGGGTITEYECSVCAEHQIVTSRYCPNCGAYMKGENNETN